MSGLHVRQMIAAFVAMALLTSGLPTAGAQSASSLPHLPSSQSSASASSAPPLPADAPTGSDLIRARGEWFQRRHIGLKRRPAADARINALRQAAGLRPTLAAIGGTWQSLGPQPIDTSACGVNCSNIGLVSGRITSLAANPSNPNELWAGAADGGAWHSTDGGQTWTAMTDSQATLSIGAIAIDPTNPSIVYLGTGEANGGSDNYWGIGILKTTDGGATWTNYGYSSFGGLSIARIAIQPGNSQDLLVAAGAANAAGTVPPGGAGNAVDSTGIWRSTDGGQTWQQVLSDPGKDYPDAGTDVVFSPANPSLAVAGLGNVRAISPTTMSGVWISTQAGTVGSWKQVTSGVPTGSDVERVSLGISQDGNQVYAVLTDGDVRDYPLRPKYGYLLKNAVYVSSNAGTTWHRQPVPTNMTSDYAISSPGHQWWYNSVVGVDPTNSQVAYAGGIDVWQTTNGGGSWSNLTNVYTTGQVHPDQHALAVMGASSSFYLGNDGGVYSYSQGTFTARNSGGLNITQFYGGSAGDAGANAMLYGGAQDNGEDQYPLNQFNSIQSWDEVLGGDGGYTAVDYLDNATVYEEYVYGAVNKSTDGAHTWTTANRGLKACATSKKCDPTNFVMPYVLSPNNNLELFAGTDRVYRTVTGGNLWSPTGPAPDPGMALSALAVAPGNDSFLYAGDNDGRVYASEDGGATWTGGEVISSTGEMVTGLAVDPTQPEIVYASFAGFNGGAGGHVFRSQDGGGSWSDISQSLPNIPFASVLVNPADGSVIAGSDAGIFISQDGGATWSTFGFGLPNVAVDQVFMNHDGTELYVATHGRGMWTIPLGLSLYFDTYYADNSVWAYNTTDGTQRWKWSAPSGIYLFTGPAEALVPITGTTPTRVIYAAGGNFYAPVGPVGYVYALNAVDGTLLWTAQLSDGVQSKPVVAFITGLGKQLVFVQTSDAYVYALDAATGQQVWNYRTGFGSSSTPYVAYVASQARQLLFLGSGDDNLYAFDPASGTVVWKHSLGFIAGPPVVANGLVYAGSFSDFMYALNAANGATIWKTKVGGAVETRPTVAGGTVYVSVDDGKLYALDVASGAVKWTVSVGFGSGQSTPLVINGGVYLNGGSGLQAVTADDGTSLWTNASTENSNSAPAVTGGIVYAGSIGGLISAFKADTGQLVWQTTSATSQVIGDVVVGP